MRQKDEELRRLLRAEGAPAPEEEPADAGPDAVTGVHYGIEAAGNRDPLGFDEFLPD